MHSLMIYSGMKRVGYSDVEIVVVETGWPSGGEPNQIGVGFDYGGSL